MILDTPVSDSQLTLRQFFELRYDKSDMADSSVAKVRYELKRWEEFTSNPPIGEITNEVAAEFRSQMLDHEYSAAYVNAAWGDFRAIFRLACPEERGNPRGLGVIPKCPYMKPVKEVRSRPRRISLHELGDVYLACEHATLPRRLGFPARDWWRALIVLAYFTGLRKGDLLNLERRQFDLREGRLTFRASKTRKEDTYPLHEIAVLHLERIWYPERELLFERMGPRQSRFYTLWKQIVKKSGVTHYFAPHDVRRTAASEIERIKTGMASVFLQHSDRDVTKLYYLNEEEELGECIHAMRYPEPFRTGTAAPLPEPLKPRREPLADPIDVRDWEFWPGGFTYRGQRHTLPGRFPRMLQLLVNAGGPLTWQQLYEGGIGRELQPAKAPARIKQSVCLLRKYLRERLGLPESVDPVPCTQRGEGGAYMLYLPTLITAAAERSASMGSEANDDR